MVRQIIFAGLAVALVGCSYSSLFVVTNHTDAAAVVTLQMDLAESRANWCLLEPGKSFIGPSVVPTERLGRWYEVDQRNYEVRYDPGNCSITLTMPPGHSAVLWQISNYSDSHAGTETFPTSVRLSGSVGEIRLEGPGLDKHFEKRSETLYVLNYGRRGA